MGYLSNGDSVSISIDSTDTEWKLREEEGMRSQMEEEYGTQIVIYIGEDVAPDQNSVDESIQVVIPTAPAAEPMPDQEAGESDYSGDGTDDGVSDYDSSDTDDGVSDYGSDDADDGISDYSVENTAGDAGEPAPIHRRCPCRRMETAAMMTAVTMAAMTGTAAMMTAVTMAAMTAMTETAAMITTMMTIRRFPHKN